MEEMGGIDGKWGVFSMVIPGRVGYQCANFYRYVRDNSANAHIRTGNFIYTQDTSHTHTLRHNQRGDSTDSHTGPTQPNTRPPTLDVDGPVQLGLQWRHVLTSAMVGISPLRTLAHRGMVKRGEIKDPNYTIDESGKLVYIKSTFRQTDKARTLGSVTDWLVDRVS